MYKPLTRLSTVPVNQQCEISHTLFIGGGGGTHSVGWFSQRIVKHHETDVIYKAVL